MRYFNTGDIATDHNLSRLDHFASPRHCSGTREHMHDWLGGVIESIEMLPAVAGKHFSSGHFKIGGAHYTASDARRAELWHGLVADLHAMIDAAEADPRLDRRGPAGPIDASDRPQTAGERVRALCDELGSASPDTREFSVILARIERDAHFGIASDVAELKRLISRKRISDYAQYKQRIAHLIYHIGIISGQMHHLR